MSYGADYNDLYRRAAVYVDKILKGAKPTDLPVQQATKFEFVINLKAAKQIGLTLSPEFLSRANQVIKWWKKTKLRCLLCAGIRYIGNILTRHIGMNANENWLTTRW
jgi:hypothetical protein